MKRIDSIANLKEKCTGCLACVDACPTNCVKATVDEDGFVYSAIDTSACISCGKCYAVCPIERRNKREEEQHLFAAYANNPLTRNSGSSGGIFGLLAEYFLEKQYAVCGAAFDGTTLKHQIITSKEDLPKLFKSKYLQSNTEGIYQSIISLLKNETSVFFCGTPCQVAALTNLVPNSLRSSLFTADFICHGVPSQAMFDAYIQTLEEQHGGAVTDFSFRVKNNRYRHAHGYSYTVIKNGKTKTVNGIYTNSSFYNAFKSYSIFRSGCYDCQYTTVERVSDITLADFWGIEKYDFKCSFDAGVSMIITNTTAGLDAFTALGDRITQKEFPIEYGVASNHCLTHQTKKPTVRDAIITDFSQKGYPFVAKKYFKSRLIHKAYWLMPPKARAILRKLRGD